MNISDLQDFFDQSQDVMAIVDRDLRYEAANLEYCRYWGVQREQLLGSDVAAIVGKKAFDSSIRKFLKRCLDGEDVVFQKWLDSPVLGRRHMDVRYTPRRDASGEVTGVFLISRDTTDCFSLQADIQRERDKFGDILTALNVGLIVYNRDLIIEWHNKQLREMFPVGQLCGGSCYSVFRGRDKPCKECPALETLRTGEECTIEKYVPSTGRTYVHSTVPLVDNNGEVSQVLGHLSDVTEQRRSLAELKDREARLDSIFRATKAGIGVVKGRVFTQANDHFFDMLGYGREELLGQNSRIVYVSDEAYENAGRTIYGAIQGSRTSTVESQWRRKDGTVLDMLITLTAINPDAPDAGVTFVAMDVSDLKRAEKAVLESELRFRNLFENVDMIAVQGYDRDRRVIYWNPASVRLYGYTREEAMGQLLEDLIIPEPMQEGVKSLHKAWVDGGIPIPAGELELIHKDGSPVPVYSCHVMQETPQGDMYMYCLDVDMGEIKRIHNRLVKAKEEAENANLAKSEFLANMSHEIRTPLNGIKGMLTLMQMTSLDDLQQEYTQAGLDSATRLNRLLSDILDLSRVEAGKMTVEKEMFNLPHLVHQVGDLFRLSFDEKDLALDCYVAPDVPKNVIGDSARLQQILTNLVGNGLKYTDIGGVRVEVSRLTPIHPGRHRVHFSVTDTGIGIRKAVLDTLFEPFIQGSRGYTRQYQGAGLGLSICKRLIQIMGGNMSVESMPGKGSSFHVVIPFDEKVGATYCARDAGEECVGVSIQLHVLLAEDDRVNSMVGQRMLEKAGCSVTVVENGTHALEVMREKEFAAIFMDVQMPDMDGVEATRRIRKGMAGDANRDIPIFALTAYTMAGDREKFLGAGMDGYVPKPVEMEDILYALRSAVRKRHGEAV